MKPSYEPGPSKKCALSETEDEENSPLAQGNKKTCISKPEWECEGGLGISWRIYNPSSGLELDFTLLTCLGITTEELT